MGGDKSPTCLLYHEGQQMTNLVDVALEYWQAGYNVLPLAPGEKYPVTSWAHWQRRPQSQAWVESRFSGHAGNIAVLGGVTSQPGRRLYPFYLDFDTAPAWRDLRGDLPATRQVSTARGGHAYFFAHRPVRTAQYKRHGFEIRGAKSYVMAPPSVHPTGKQYAFNDVDQPVAVVDSLPICDLDFDAIPADYMQPLPRLVQRILRNDAKTLGRYPTRSEIDAAVIMALTRSGRDLAQIMAILDGASYPSHYRNLPEKRRYAWLLGVYKKCQAAADRPEWAEAQDEITRFRAVVISLQPKEITTSRTGVTDKRVLLAHIGAAQAAGDAGDYHLSERDGSETAQVTGKTFALATNRLRFHGWVSKSTGNVATLAARYALKTDCANLLHSVTGKTVVTECSKFDHFASKSAPDDTPKRAKTGGDSGVFEYGRRNRDGERRGGLGRGPGETFAVLQRAGLALTVNELVDMTGFTRQTVKRHLLRLSTVGLVDVDGDLVSVGEFDTETAGAILGTLNIGEKRRDRHTRQRAAWRQFFKKEEGVVDGEKIG